MLKNYRSKGIAHYAAAVTLSLGVSATAGAAKENKTAEISFTVNDACEVYVQSTKDISNIVVDGVKYEYEYDATGGAHPIGREYPLGTYGELINIHDDTINVKSGNNGVRGKNNKGLGDSYDVEVPMTPACEEPQVDWGTCPWAGSEELEDFIALAKSEGFSWTDVGPVIPALSEYYNEYPINFVVRTRESGQQWGVEYGYFLGARYFQMIPEIGEAPTPIASSAQNARNYAVAYNDCRSGLIEALNVYPEIEWGECDCAKPGSVWDQVDIRYPIFSAIFKTLSGLGTVPAYTDATEGVGRFWQEFNRTYTIDSPLIFDRGASIGVSATQTSCGFTDPRYMTWVLILRNDPSMSEADLRSPAANTQEGLTDCQVGIATTTPGGGSIGPSGTE